jgi:hypothetical protein
LELNNYPKSLQIGEHTYHFLTSQIEYIELPLGGEKKWVVSEVSVKVVSVVVVLVVVSEAVSV